ncbi:hypothetical protein [Brevundimonas nasdae]|uniref:hypothetical protein n=1 Tax=Brevundimonas nasdae TaxID=172043 RepID=UPI003F69120B
MRRVARLRDPKAAARAKTAIRRRVQLSSPPLYDRSAPVQAPSPRRWPLLLNRTELCEYLGLSWSTLKGVLAVSPIDMGASVIRYNRQQIDAWVETRPNKSKLPVSIEEGADENLEALTHEAVTAALDRARTKGRPRL